MLADCLWQYWGSWWIGLPLQTMWPGQTPIKQVRDQPYLNGRPFKNDRAFISTRSALPASVYKHPGVYKRSASLTCIILANIWEIQRGTSGRKGYFRRPHTWITGQLSGWWGTVACTLDFFCPFTLGAFLEQYYLYKTDQNLHKNRIKNNYTELKWRIINLIQ